MDYTVKDHPIHGKVLADKNGKMLVVDSDTAWELAGKYDGGSRKITSNRYIIKVSEMMPEGPITMHECDCDDGDVKPQTYNQEPDHEVQMARSELYRAAKSAIALHEMLKQVTERQGLEGWVQNKITRAADYLETVYDYLDYEMRYPSEELMGEATPGMTTPTPPPPAGAPAAAANNPAVVAAQDADDAKAMAGMVTMGKRDAQGKVIKTSIKTVPAAQVAGLQKTGFHVVGSGVMETTSAGAVAAAPGIIRDKKKVGSLFGGTYKQNEAANPAQQAAIAISMKKAGKKPKDKEEESVNPFIKRVGEGLKDPEDNPCWKGYKPVGTKKKNGKTVPNCVPAKGVKESEKETGPKFTGYWKGTDKGNPGKKMVGSN